ncbi:hypothetical protein EUGRSUZ_A00609 [Eucalyptus grandis]|uniref:Uncharacterized protein n=2 Tax=Eucalyptus grandis TaxID=71139 RepID=A0ACC3M1E4_EUCGR|nr:hypothetical protein EUGRSUZ_A00609 [Eucalyptus grandis]
MKKGNYKNHPACLPQEHFASSNFKTNLHPLVSRSLTLHLTVSKRKLRTLAFVLHSYFPGVVLKSIRCKVYILS